jgi:hypothetical protein
MSIRAQFTIEPDRHLTASGGLFSMFAFAAMLRILMVATQLNQDADLQPLLAWLPAACWSTAALLLFGLPRLRRVTAS